MGIEIRGLEEFKKQLEGLGQKIERLNGSHQVPITDLITPSFLAGYSHFKSLDEMIQASGFKVESEEDFKAIPDVEWDTFIRNNTLFGTWQEMLEAAAGDWAIRQIGV